MRAGVGREKQLRATRAFEKNATPMRAIALPRSATVARAISVSFLSIVCPDWKYDYDQSHKSSKQKDKSFLGAEGRFCCPLNVGTEAPTPEITSMQLPSRRLGVRGPRRCDVSQVRHSQGA